MWFYVLDPCNAATAFICLGPSYFTFLLMVFVGGLAVLGALSYALSHQLVAVADRLPSAAQELREALQRRGQGGPGPVGKVQQAANELEKLSGTEAVPEVRPKIQTVAIEKKPFDLGDYLWQGSLSVTTFIGDSVVVLFLALYLLLAGDLFRRRFVEIAGPTLSQKKVTLQILDAISLQIGRYLFVRAVISAIVGVGTFVAFWAIGLEQQPAGVWRDGDHNRLWFTIRRRPRGLDRDRSYHR
jgi:predicted PurR-regulated permease PerM